MKIIKLFNRIKKSLSAFKKIKSDNFNNDEINGALLDKINYPAEQADLEQADLDKKLVYSFSKTKIPTFKQVKYIKKCLNKREIWLLGISFFILAISLIFLSAQFYFTRLQIVPIRGGEYAEGLVGSPKYINPLYAGFSDVDSDISGLVFSSLLKRNADGQLANDLAAEYEISEDNKIYTFKIRTDVRWHNDTPLTVDDIMFTFNAIKDSRYNSPLGKSFVGVEIEKIGESDIRFVLAEPYAAFLELLTFGVLPQDLWYQFSPSSASLAGLNLKPVGSGPYKAAGVVKDEKTGEIKSYLLTANENYYGQPARIEKLKFVFFPNFKEAVQALNEGIINGISYLPKQLEKNLAAQDSLNLHKLNLPQLTAVFFNQKNNDFLTDKSARQALALAVNKNEIITNNLGGDARLVDGPILPDSFAYNQNNKKYNYNKEEAIKLLDDAGWKEIEITEDEITAAQDALTRATSTVSSEKEEQDEERTKDVKNKNKNENKLAMGAGKWRRKDDKFLTIKLTAVETDENLGVVELIKKYWEEIGVKTEIELIPASQIKADIINSRNFEALFYSQILGADPDLYVFWHSSQIGEGGLNLSDYANKDVDRLLEDARISSNIQARKEKYKKFQEIITEDLPAIFLYSPTYTYVQSKKVKGFGVKSIFIPRDRFSNITEWYVKTGKKLVF